MSMKWTLLCAHEYCQQKSTFPTLLLQRFPRFSLPFMSTDFCAHSVWVEGVQWEITHLCDSTRLQHSSLTSSSVVWLLDSESSLSSSPLSDIDECLSSPCANGGTCTDEVNGFSCVCAKGWAGPTCQSPTPTCGFEFAQNHIYRLSVWRRSTEWCYQTYQSIEFCTAPQTQKHTEIQYRCSSVNGLLWWSPTLL